LVNDLITCYHIFKENQPKIHDILTNVEAKVLVDVIKTNYILNKQAWAELEYYNTNKSLLGKHPIFNRIRLKDAISALSTPKLIKKQKALEINIYRNKGKGNTELVERDTDLLMHTNLVLEKR